MTLNRSITPCFLTLFCHLQWVASLRLSFDLSSTDWLSTMSTFGTLFRVTTYGESHGLSVGCIIDGCPPGLRLTREIIQGQLNRRRPGQSELTTPRDEKDAVVISSGIENGVTLGSPIGMQVMNEDQRQHDYSETDTYPRPSHADLTYILKYGLKSGSGGGRSSARETIGRVAAGAIAEAYLSTVHNVEIVGFVSSVGKVQVDYLNDMEFLSKIKRSEVDADACRCPVPSVAGVMKKTILAMKEAKDSIGGTVTCVIRNVPPGLGEPCFDKLEAKLAHAMLSIPACKAFEVGSGFRGTEYQGSIHNDPFVKGTKTLSTSTNHSGGIQGGISNGENIYFRVAFKPPATIGLPQVTANYDGVDGILEAKGRHDPCVVPRAVPIVEAMAALVIMDAVLIQNSRMGSMAGLKSSTIKNLE